MTIKEEEILKIAKLAKLEISEDELPIFMQKLQSIMDSIDSLQKIDDLPEEAMSSSVEEGYMHFNEDEVNNDEIAEKLMQITPHQTRNISQNTSCYVVKKVVNK